MAWPCFIMWIDWLLFPITWSKVVKYSINDISLNTQQYYIILFKLLGVIILPYKSEIKYNPSIFPSLLSMQGWRLYVKNIWSSGYVIAHVQHKEYYFGKFCYDKPVWAYKAILKIKYVVLWISWFIKRSKLYHFRVI